MKKKRLADFGHYFRNALQFRSKA